MHLQHCKEKSILEAKLKSQFSDVFSGYHLHQESVLNRHFEDHLSHHHQMVLKMSVQYKCLMQLIAQEDFIEFSHHESSRTCKKFSVFPLLWALAV
jgi:hypothetical protein